MVEPGTHEIRSGDRLYTVNVVRMEGSDDEAAVLSFEDHTEKRRLQEQLIQSEKMSAIGQLIAGIAHDLNNPLASVVGFADFLVLGMKSRPHLRVRNLAWLLMQALWKRVLSAIYLIEMGSDRPRILDKDLLCVAVKPTA